MKYTITYYSPEWVYKEIRRFFGVHEFFRPAVVSWAQKRYPTSWENKLWSYLEFRNLSNLLFIRINIAKRITINRGSSQQRGMRDNLCRMMLSRAALRKLYLSAHVRGAGVDYDVEDTTAEGVRNWIVGHGNELPYHIRLEWKKVKTGKPIPWVHQDSNFEPGHPKVYRFNV